MAQVRPLRLAFATPSASPSNDAPLLSGGPTLRHDSTGAPARPNPSGAARLRHAASAAAHLDAAPRRTARLPSPPLLPNSARQQTLQHCWRTPVKEGVGHISASRNAVFRFFQEHNPTNNYTFGALAAPFFVWQQQSLLGILPSGKGSL
ncbi:unnamed protein product [Miscanthus lutarioriparius]|uniref:Uncharacterized protein n=1 Tax=Miscanthus lutarioriparius TaxID=422564 RepID=A0A811MT23_9POAL|nr:unnamed protein product [Miscanthus lutarioriparius]